MPDDYSADRFTTGTVAVGDTATGNIGSNGDSDWFAVELEAGRTYVIDLRGSPTDDGTLSDPYLRGIHDSGGNLIARTTNDDGGEGYNSRVTFTATESGTHYIAAGAAGVFSGRGTYEVEVTDTSPPLVAPDPDSEDPPDTQEQVQQQPPAFGSRFYGFELPEDTDGSANRISLGTVSATDSDGRSVTYSIEGGNAAGLFEIDTASGELFYTGGGEDYETGSTSFELTVRASDGDQTTDTTVAVNVTDVAEAPAFGQAGYGFDLAEDTDGSTNRISLGTVLATDPDGGSVTYSIEDGNAAGLFEIDAASGELFYTGGGEDYETGSTSFELTIRASDGDQTADTTVTVNVTDVLELPTTEPQGGASPVSESSNQDLPADTSTTGVVVPTNDRDSPRATGNIQTPGDVDWFEMTLQADHNYWIRVSGADQGDNSPTVVGVYDATGTQITDRASSPTSSYGFSPATDGTHYVAIARVPSTSPNSTGQSAQTGPYSVRVREYPDLPEDSTTSEFTYVDGGGGFEFFETPGDRDWIRITSLEAGASYIIDVMASDRPGLIGAEAPDVKLFSVRDSTGAVIPNTEDDDGGVGQNARLKFTAPSTGTYYLDVGTSDVSTGVYDYRVVEDDYAADEATSGRVAVGGTATGAIGHWSEHDWFAVELVAGRTYTIDLRGSSTDDGTLSDPYLRGVYDADGDRISGTMNNDGGTGRNSRATFTATESGTHYIVAASSGLQAGTYEVEVTDSSRTPPAFEQRSYAFDLAEDTDGSTDRISLGAVSATDPDGGSVSYSMEGGNAAGLFEIDAASGELFYTGGGEDYETGSTSFELTIRASDGDQTTDTTVTVNVTDVDEPVEDNPPVVQPDQSTPQTVSEPAGEDFARNSSTSGRVAVGDTATGRLGSSGDRDWFAVEPVAGRTYVIDLRGSPTDDGTLRDPFLRGIYDADGNRISNTADDDGGQGYNSRVTFTATESGTHYIAAGAYSGQGTYELEVTDTSPVESPTTDGAGPVSELENQDLPADTTTTGMIVPMRSWSSPQAIGNIQEPGDVDWFAMTLKADHHYHIDVIQPRERPPGIEVTGIYDSDGTLVSTNRWDFSPNADGTYFVAIASPENPITGTYSVAFFEYPDLSEDTATSEFVYVNQGGEGYLETPGDKDWIRVTLEAGKSYIVDVKPSEYPGMIGEGPLDVKLFSVRDATGNVIANTEADGGGVGQDARLMFTAPTAGTYYLEVGTSDNSTGRYYYSVHEDDYAADEATTGEVVVGGEISGVINSTGDRDWFELNLERGTRYTITLERGTLEESGVSLYPPESDPHHRVMHASRSFEFIAWSDEPYFVAVKGGGGRSTGTYTLSVSEHSWGDDLAADTTTTGSVELHQYPSGNVWGQAVGIVESAGDEDWFAVELEAGRTYNMVLQGRPTYDGTLTNPYLNGIHDPNGNLIANTSDDDGGEGLNSRVALTPTANGTYYVAAGAYGDEVGTYELTIWNEVL